ncbi:hypothetical protein CCACVL1_16654 [Corchorus capsularis]|uniref:Uncharacterized protein n=1 Tax=Corchorus capsularis TaxID=210143 RepID=A0A1R3HVW3_COCAP|nr:hypothetical protein CCACVL1_16654 [Corchorus capsularis]
MGREWCERNPFESSKYGGAMAGCVLARDSFPVVPDS